MQAKKMDFKSIYKPIKIEMAKHKNNITIIIAAIDPLSCDTQLNTAHYLLFHIPDHCEDFLSYFAKIIVVFYISQRLC